MRVEKKNSSSLKKKGRSAATGASESARFEGIMSEMEVRGITDELNGYILEIDELGKLLSRFPNNENLDNYKKKISAFLKEALPKVMKLSEIQGADVDGRQKIYFKIEKIESKLSQMTDGFFSRDKEKFNLVERMDEIRGLILDLMV